MFPINSLLLLCNGDILKSKRQHYMFCLYNLLLHVIRDFLKPKWQRHVFTINCLLMHNYFLQLEQKQHKPMRDLYALPPGIKQHNLLQWCKLQRPTRIPQPYSQS
jgi:hypothetical protein